MSHGKLALLLGGMGAIIYGGVWISSQLNIKDPIMIAGVVGILIGAVAFGALGLKKITG